MKSEQIFMNRYVLPLNIEPRIYFISFLFEPESLPKASILVLNIPIIFGKPSQWLIAVTLKIKFIYAECVRLQLPAISSYYTFVCAIEDQILFLC